MEWLIPAVVGCAIAAGLMIALAAWRGVLPEFDAESSFRGIDNVPLRVALGISAAVVVFLVTRWPVAGIYAGAGGVAAPTLMRAKKERVAAVERVEALATWVESLRAIMGASGGIQEAIRVSAKVAPAPIQREVQDLAVRLQHESVGTALRRFAADMAHPVSDSVVAALVMANQRQAGGLQTILTGASRSARDYASMWRRVEGGRARGYAQSRIVVATSALFITGIVLFRRGFVEPFDSFGGQIALAVVGGAFFFGGVARYRLARPVAPLRVFSRIEHDGGGGVQRDGAVALNGAEVFL